MQKIHAVHIREVEGETRPLVSIFTAEEGALHYFEAAKQNAYLAVRFAFEIPSDASFDDAYDHAETLVEEGKVVALESFDPRDESQTNRAWAAALAFTRPQTPAQFELRQRLQHALDPLLQVTDSAKGGTLLLRSLGAPMAYESPLGPVGELSDVLRIDSPTLEEKVRHLEHSLPNLPTPLFRSSAHAALTAACRQETGYADPALFLSRDDVLGSDARQHLVDQMLFLWPHLDKEKLERNVLTVTRGKQRSEGEEGKERFFMVPVSQALFELTPPTTEPTAEADFSLDTQFVEASRQRHQMFLSHMVQVLMPCMAPGITREQLEAALLQGRLEVPSGDDLQFRDAFYARSVQGESSDLTAGDEDRDEDNPWETGELGCDEAFVAPASDEGAAIDQALGLKMINLRLPQALIDAYKAIAPKHGIGHTTLMRQVLTQWMHAQKKQD